MFSPASILIDTVLLSVYVVLSLIKVTAYVSSSTDMQRPTGVPSSQVFGLRMCPHLSKCYIQTWQYDLYHAGGL